MKLLYKLLGQKPGTREAVITVTSALGLIVNLAIAGVKIAIGAAVSSIAIISEGIHSGADAATSVLTILGVKLSHKRPTQKHPFGYGRIEYLTSLAIGVLILYTGIEIFVTSIDLIFHPTELAISYLTLAIVAGTAVIKFLLGVYTMKKGKSVESDTLVALGAECRNDSFASMITIASAVVFLVFRLSVDAYAGLITALLIFKTGVEILRSTLADLLGKSGNRELANQLYQEIRATEGVVNAADMMLHNYGPDAWSASVNIEIDHAKTVGEVYQFLHELQLRILQQYHVTMVFGIYAVDNQNEASKKMRKHIAQFVREHPHVISYHALYYHQAEKRIYCDFVVDYSSFDWELLRQEFTAYMTSVYPECTVDLTVETEFV